MIGKLLSQSQVVRDHCAPYAHLASEAVREAAARTEVSIAAVVLKTRDDRDIDV